MEGAIALVVFLMVFAVAGIAAHFAWRLWQRHAHRKEALYREGRCVGCGYDVRTLQGRCPECGSDLFAQGMEYWRERFAQR